MCWNLISIYEYIICQMACKRSHLFHNLKDIITNIRYRCSRASPVICFLCVLHDIVYQILNTLSQIYYLTIAKVPVSLPQAEIIDLFYHNYHIWASADKVALNSGVSLNLQLLFVYGSSDDPGKSTHLHRLDWVFIVSQCDMYQNHYLIYSSHKSRQTGHSLDTNRW